MNATMAPTDENLKLNPTCRFCSAPLDYSSHPLIEVVTQRVVCACDDCATRFEKNSGGPFKLIPRTTREILDFLMPDVPWIARDLPGNVTFIFYSTGSAKLFSVCKVETGTVESTVPREVWKAVIEANPTLEEMRPDVEGLLIVHTGATREYFIAPIDVCYNLVKTTGKNELPDALTLLPQEFSYAS